MERTTKLLLGSIDVRYHIHRLSKVESAKCRACTEDGETVEYYFARVRPSMDGDVKSSNMPADPTFRKWVPTVKKKIIEIDQNVRESIVRLWEEYNKLTL